MAKANFTVPELQQYLEVPAVTPGTMAIGFSLSRSN